MELLRDLGLGLCALRVTIGWLSLRMFLRSSRFNSAGYGLHEDIDGRKEAQKVAKKGSSDRESELEILNSVLRLMRFFAAIVGIDAEG